MKLSWFVRLISAGLLYLSPQPAMADTWTGHLASLRDAKIACRDINSAECLPYLAQAVAVADTLSAQALSEQNEISIPGRAGSTLICNTAVLHFLNGQYLMLVALTADDKTLFYWDDALLASALRSCRLR